MSDEFTTTATTSDENPIRAMRCTKFPTRLSSSDSGCIMESTHGGSRNGSDLPSPASSTIESETSDYQRSTPSPRDHDSGIGSLEDWPERDNANHSVDQGLGDEMVIPEEPKITTKSDCQKKVLRQVRVALEKLPDDKLPPKFFQLIRTSIPTATTPTTTTTASVTNKRRHSDSSKTTTVNVAAMTNPQGCKKIRLDVNGELGNQGKITEYLSEMKHFTALRKEKLDRVLNLKTEASTTATTTITTTSSTTTNTTTMTITHNNKSHNLLQKCQQSTPNGNKSSEDASQHKFEIPKTVLRFPLKNPNSPIQCRWESCGEGFESTGKLLDHLKNVHASSRAIKEGEKFKCLWEGCKVFGKSSCSKSWLEKHVTYHGGNKPFQCIVDGCKQRFSTQSLLERHVNGHFKSNLTPPTGVCKKSCDPISSSSSSHSNAISSYNTSCLPYSTSSSPLSASSSSSSSSSSSASSSGSGNGKLFPKVIKKAGRKFKYRKTIFSARIFDLFDIGIMARVQEKLAKIESSRIMSQDNITFSSKIIGKKRDNQGKVMLLVRWSPENLLDDEWVDYSNLTPTKTLKIRSLPETAKIRLSQMLIGRSTGRPSGCRKITPYPRKTALS